MVGVYISRSAFRLTKTRLIKHKLMMSVFKRERKKEKITMAKTYSGVRKKGIRPRLISDQKIKGMTMYERKNDLLGWEMMARTPSTNKPNPSMG